jgi:hypothetical protein
MGTKQFDNYADLITFTRASGGTALRPISYGSELVTNGTFDSDATGSTPATWETNSANASLIKQADGTALFSSTSFAYARVEAASRPILPVGLYRVSFEISEWLGSLALVHVGINTGGNVISGNGTYSYIFTSAAEQAYELQIRPNGGGTGSFKIDNISVKEVLFDQPNAPLTLFNHPTNIPRIEYDADGNRLGLLVEEQRTNLLTYSEDFANAYWPKNDVTVAASSEVDPSGGASAYELIESATNANHLLNKAGLAGANTYSEFIFAKANTRSWVRLQSQSPINSWVNVNLATGEKGLSGGSEDSYSIQDVGNGWYKISLSFTATSATGYQLFVLDSDRGGSSPSYLGDGSSSILIYGAQFEAGAFPTSYIPTSGSTATRAADVVSITGADFKKWFNPAEGTLYVEASSIQDQNAVLAAISDGSYNNRIAISRGGTTLEDRLLYVITANGSTQATATTSTSYNSDENVKSILGYKVNDFNFTINAISINTDSSGIIPTVDSLGIGNYSNFPAANQLNGHIKSIKYYPRRLTNAQLQELTQ